ncbi:hypothetical protein Agub_g11122, partial [Astrephomene gubernaculifera]
SSSGGGGQWGPLDLSSTPNRLLQSVLTVPARLSPSILTVQSSSATSGLAMSSSSSSSPTSSTSTSSSSTSFSAATTASSSSSPVAVLSASGSATVEVALQLRPSAQVNITASVPAAWNGEPLADLYPSSLSFTPSDFNRSRRLLLQPNPAAAQGSYYVQLAMRSSDPRFDFAVQVFKVQDTRPQVGETAADPRVIRSLPFLDSGTTLQFRHDYATSPGNPLDTSPDVVYALTPAQSMSLSASTCGSSYDTVLLLGLGDLAPEHTLANDDDPSCGSSPPASSCSRIDQDLDIGVTYYFVVSGFNGARGDYVFSVVCRSCDSSGAVGGAAAVASS